MGEYIKQQRMLNGRSVYVGGHDGDMALYFDNNGWLVTYEDTIGAGGFFMYVDDPAIIPDRIKAPWKVDQGKQPAASLRVCKFLGRETILEISGLPSEHCASSCVGRYTRETCSHNEKPTYKGTRLADGMAIWFSDGLWCVGRKKNIGTLVCSISADDSAHTPDVAQSTWRVQQCAEYDEQIQVCGASAQQSLSATASHHQAQRSMAHQSSAPPKLAVVGSDKEDESYDGTYTKLQREVGSRVVYAGGGNGKQAIWYLLQAGGVACWCVGPKGGYWHQQLLHVRI
jgi:hypothetical protein